MSLSVARGARQAWRANEAVLNEQVRQPGTLGLPRMRAHRSRAIAPPRESTLKRTARKGLLDTSFRKAQPALGRDVRARRSDFQFNFNRDLFERPVPLRRSMSGERTSHAHSRATAALLALRILPR